MKFILSGSAALCLLANTVWAQPSFDAASVRLAGPGQGGGPQGGPGTSNPGRITYTRAPLGILLTAAYGVSNDQISGPAWLNDFSDPHVYALTATMPPDTTKEQFRLMMQNLLTDRFHLRIHHETREFPGYDLVLSGRTIKLKEWDPKSPPAPTGVRADANGFPILPPGLKSASINMMGRFISTHATYRETMAEFAAGLGFQVRAATGGNAGSPAPRVTDKTGLNGIYELHLYYEAASPFLNAAPEGAGADDPTPSGPTLFNALTDQLGLKLQKGKSIPLDVIVIDHADPVPAEN